MSCLEIVREEIKPVLPPIKEVILRLSPAQARYIRWLAAHLASPVAPATLELYNLLEPFKDLPVEHNLSFR